MRSRILIVEDDLRARALLEEFLVRHGLSMPGDARSMFVKQVDAGRGTHLIEIKPVLDHVVLFVLEDRIAEKERLSEIEEQARAHAAPELGRHWQHRLELAGQCGITAVGIAKRVARTECEFQVRADWRERLPPRWVRGKPESGHGYIAVANTPPVATV